MQIDAQSKSLRGVAKRLSESPVYFVLQGFAISPTNPHSFLQFRTNVHNRCDDECLHLRGALTVETPGVGYSLLTM